MLACLCVSVCLSVCLSLSVCLCLCLCVCWQAMKYLRFAGVQRNVNLKDLDAEISDFKESRIQEDDHFSSDDVRELMDSLVTSIRAEVFRDLQRMAHSTVVLLRQCMQQAAEHGISLSIDTGLLEDEKFLLEAKRMEEETERTPEALKDLAPAGMGSVSKPLSKLPGLESAKTAEALSAENAILKQRLADLQKDLVEINREKTTMSERLMMASALAADEAQDPPPAYDGPSVEGSRSATVLPVLDVPGGGRAGGLAPLGGASGGAPGQLCAKCGGASSGAGGEKPGASRRRSCWRRCKSWKSRYR